MQIHVINSDREEGPYDLDEVNRLLSVGALSPDDLAWHSGLKEWQPLRTIAGVHVSGASPVRGGPPPLPGVVRYVGFWRRVVAAIVDSILVLLVTLPIVVSVYGWAYFAPGSPMIAGPVDFVVTWILPAVAVLLFWIYRQATPGKIIVSARILDAATLKKPSAGQLVLRYLGYYVSIIPFGLGILWVAFDPKKQGWHDKIAKTVVVDDASDESDKELR